MNQSVYIINTPPGWVKTPPLSLAYLKTYLGAQGIDVNVMDLNILLFGACGASKTEWLSLNDSFERNLFDQAKTAYPEFFDNVYRRIEKVDIIGFSLFKRNAPFTLSLARAIKDRFPEKRIVLGGPHTLFMERENQLHKDYTWVIGEGEIPFYKIASGDKRQIFKFEEIENLDSLPFLDFQAFNLKSYYPALPLFSSRGCRFNCSFCSERLLYKDFRRHSPRYVAEEIKIFKLKYAIDNFVFCDSMINSSDDWLEEFCGLLIAENIDIKWEAQMRITPGLKPAVAALIKKSGCFNLFIGLESGANHILNIMQKGFTSQTALEFFNTLRQAELHFEISLIFGYPEETEADFNETLDFVLKNKRLIPKIAQVNPFVDYMRDYPDREFPTPQALARVDNFVRAIEREEIKYTRSFINNLIY